MLRQPFAQSAADKFETSPESQSPRTRQPVRQVLAGMRRSWQAYALLSPIFLLLIVFVYYPPLLGLFRSFFDWRLGQEPVFVGLQNFQTYASLPESGRELKNVGILLVFSLLTQVVMPFVMSELIFAVRSKALKELYRLMIVIPTLVPGVVYVLLWRHIYDPNLGPLNALLEALGLSSFTHNWLGDPNTALLAIIGVGFPWVAGVGTLIFLGGLANISDSVLDACLLDGCQGLKRVRLIDLPLVLPQIRLLTILASIAALTSFEGVLVMTRGGPGYATSVPGLRMFERAFTTGQFGLASSIGLILFVLALIFTFVVNRLTRSKV
ncbi:MAG: sugar ABC transporter permease [Anaerolineae bacterium]|nr:sugar ABC transporter permease [Anaerolineae bacterium]